MTHCWASPNALCYRTAKGTDGWAQTHLCMSCIQMHTAHPDESWKKEELALPAPIHQHPQKTKHNYNEHFWLPAPTDALQAALLAIPFCLNSSSHCFPNFGNVCRDWAVSVLHVNFPLPSPHTPFPPHSPHPPNYLAKKRSSIPFRLIYSLLLSRFRL